MNRFDLETITAEAYQASLTLIEETEMRAVVTRGLSLMYGPPIENPNLAFVSFQGGGADQTIQRTWPPRLLYRDDPYKFGQALRKYCDTAGLRASLDNSAIALPVVFPQAPTAEAASWMAKSGPKAKWREFSKEWTQKLLLAYQPKVVIVFGEKASRVLGIPWKGIEKNHGQRHMTYAHAHWHGIPMIFCHHLSIGCPESEAIRAFRSARDVLDGRGP